MSLVVMDVGSIEDGLAEDVPLSELPVGHAWRVAGLDTPRVRDLSGVLATTAPIVVRRVDRLVVDGAHRVAAARRLGRRSLSVEWFEGSTAEAFGEFVARNLVDGLVPTVDDRRHGVTMILGSEAAWSDRRIAHICGVSPKLVARLRCETGVAGADKRIGRDGRARPLRVGPVRTRIAAAISEDPGASLRSIAALFGVSPETVRSVRKELQDRNEGPEPTQPRRRQVEMTVERFLSFVGSTFPWRRRRGVATTPFSQPRRARPSWSGSTPPLSTNGSTAPRRCRSAAPTTLPTTRDGAHGSGRPSPRASRRAPAAAVESARRAGSVGRDNPTPDLRTSGAVP